VNKKNIVEKTLEAPARTLQKGLDKGERITKNMPLGSKGPVRRIKDYWYMLGPGLTTGASDDDPSGIATYSQAGAQYGLKLLWLAPFTFPFMAVAQEMCARIGLVTGRGLAANIRTHFGRKVLYFSTILLFLANTFNIGADLGAIASGLQLLNPHINYYLLVVASTLVILFMQIFTSYAKYAKYLKWLALILFTYILSAILAHPDWHDILKNSYIPRISFNKQELLIVCAVLGTTITPYLFFWQTSQEVEDQNLAGQNNSTYRNENVGKEIKNMRVDVWSGMLLSNLVMFFIIAACGSILFQHGINTITTASQAAEALRPFAGSATYWLFAAGIIGVALLAIPVMAGASAYAISESLGKRQGLNKKLKQGYTFYGVIILSMLIGMMLNFIGLNPIKALIYSAVLNGIVAPVILILILIIARNKKIMGKWKNGKLSAFLGWVITIFMGLSGVAAIYSLF